MRRQLQCTCNKKIAPPHHPFLNTVRRWLPRATAHSRRARHTRTPTPTPGDGTNTGLHPPHYPAHYRPPLRTRTPQDRRGKKELTGWSEHNQPVSHCSPSPAALPAVLHQPRLAHRKPSSGLTADRVALATFPPAGTYRESASAPPNNENSTVPPHHRTTTHSLNKPTHTGCVGPAAKYCLLITSCGPPTATRRAPPRATRY